MRTPSLGLSMCICPCCTYHVAREDQRLVELCASHVYAQDTKTKTHTQNVPVRGEITSDDMCGWEMPWAKQIMTSKKQRIERHIRICNCHADSLPILTSAHPRTGALRCTHPCAASDSPCAHRRFAMRRAATPHRTQRHAHQTAVRARDDQNLWLLERCLEGASLMWSQRSCRDLT